MSFIIQPGEAGNVKYQGKTLPADAIPHSISAVDQINNPALVIIGNLQLPPDTVIRIAGKKCLAKSQIVDGPSVFERTGREATEIIFEGVIREKDNDRYIYPQNGINNVFANAWVPSTVQPVQNTLLNGIGISEVIIDSINPTQVRGVANIPFQIRAYENIPGLTIAIKG